jgi:hypothetical protein
VLKRFTDRARRMRQLPGRINNSLVQAEFTVPDIQRAVHDMAHRVGVMDTSSREQSCVLLERLNELGRRMDHLSWEIHHKLGSLSSYVDATVLELEDTRSRYDLGDAIFEQFQRDRASSEYQKVYDGKDPLVSVCIATYNRAELLVSRSVRSVLEQDYQPFEVIVVGDHCTDDTEARLKALGDSRLRFENLPQRGEYPAEPYLRWLVAGTAPLNRALELSRGDFVTHLDDDDEHPPDRLRKLVAFIREKRVDLVLHPFEFEAPDRDWRVNEGSGFFRSQVTTSSVLYHNWFRRVGWDPRAYLYLEPGDWNRFRKLRWLGATTARHPERLLRHYRERNQNSM